MPQYIQLYAQVLTKAFLWDELAHELKVEPMQMAFAENEHYRAVAFENIMNDKPVLWQISFQGEGGYLGIGLKTWSDL